MWTVDPEKHALVGISAGGKRGRRGLRTLGDCFISLQRHHRAIGLPEELMVLPDKNLEERDPDDWAASEEMDRVVKEELEKLPNGKELLKRAEQYQREAAEDWLRRYRSTKPGVDKTYADLTEAKKRVRELKLRLKEEQQVTERTRLAIKSLFKFPNVVKFLRSFGEAWKIVEGLLKGLGLKYVAPATSAPTAPDMTQPQDDAERATESPAPAEASQNVAMQNQAEPSDGAADKRGQLDKELERRRREREKSKDSPEMGM